MTTIYDIKKRAQQLSEKTDSETISPQEVGGLFSDLADYANDVDVNGSSLGIRKTYTSVSAMEADKNPVGDDGKPLKKGQLVNIYNQDDPSSADNNKVFSWQNPGWQIRTTLDAGYATREELTELENGSGKMMQLPYSFIKTNDGLSTHVRANNFSPAKVYGIVYYATAVGYFDLYSFNKNDYSVSKIVTVLCEKIGINYYILDSPFEITNNILLGYAGTLIGTNGQGNVIGMWQTKISDESGNNFYSNFEACYGIITSEFSLDEIIRLNSTENNALLFKAPIGKEFSNQGLKNLWRGNRVDSGVVYSLMLYSDRGDYIQYALLDVINKSLSNKSEKKYVEKGWNYISIPELEVDIQHVIVVKSDNDSIPLNTQEPCIGLVQFKEEKSEVTIYNQYEIAIFYITNINYDKSLAVRYKRNAIMPFNDLSSINKYKSSFKRANNHPDCTAKGLIVYSLGSSIIEYGLIDINNNYNCEKIGESFVKNGLNTIIFDESIEAKEGKKIYISNITSPSVGVIDTGGMGMYQANEGINNYYDGWELACGIILDDVFDRIDDNYELKYGEILLPKDIYIATDTQCNLWWSSIANVAEGDKSIYFDITASNTDNVYNAERCLRIQSGYAKDITITILSRKSDDRSIIDKKTITIHIVSKLNGNGVKGILMCGDSRTWQRVNGVQGDTYLSDDNKTITTETKKLLDDNKGATFTFYGTFESKLDPTVKNLAQSGWKFDNAIQTITSAGGIKQYIEVSCGAGSGATLDYCTCMYGINDLMDWNSKYISQYDYSTAKIDGILAKCKEFISLIKAGYPNCKIIVVIESTTCANQDGFAYWDGNQTKVNSHIEVEKAQKLFRKRLIKMIETDYADDNNVILSSAGIWCDRLWGFPYTKTEESNRCSHEKIWFRNNVHPHDDGYKQISDGIFSTIKYLEL